MTPASNSEARKRHNERPTNQLGTVRAWLFPDWTTAWIAANRQAADTHLRHHIAASNVLGRTWWRVTTKETP